MQIHYERFANKLTNRKDWKGVWEAHKKVGSTPFNVQIGIDFNVEWKRGWDVETRIVEKSDRGTVSETKIITPQGTLTSKRRAGFFAGDPTLGKRTEYFIKEKKDYRIYQNYLEEWAKLARPDISKLNNAVNELGEDGVFTVWITSIFYEIGQARGMEEYLIDFHDDPSLMREVGKTVQKFKEAHIQAFNESLAEVFIYDVCWASTSIVSPKFFEEWVLPDLKWAVDNIEKDKYIGPYMSGKMKKLLPMMVEARPDFIQTFDTVSGDVSLREAKERYGDKICIMGNYSPVILAKGSLEEAKKETIRCLEEGAEEGGYILGTGDEVPADAKLENMKVMVQTAEEWGK